MWYSFLVVNFTSVSVKMRSVGGFVVISLLMLLKCTFCAGCFFFANSNSRSR